MGLTILMLLYYIPIYNKIVSPSNSISGYNKKAEILISPFLYHAQRHHHMQPSRIYWEIIPLSSPGDTSLMLIPIRKHFRKNLNGYVAPSLAELAASATLFTAPSPP